MPSSKFGEFSLDQHWAYFREFCRLELASGGPDPHLKLCAYAMRQEPDPLERAWMALCYVAPYEVSTGAVLWSTWPLRRRVEAPGLGPWLQEHWRGLQIRRERRAARTPTKMLASLESARYWIVTDLPKLQAFQPESYAGPVEQVDAFDALWSSAKHGLQYFGRYALIKVLETLQQGGVVDAPAYDIRPDGGWSPRATLALLFPDHEAALNGSNSPDDLAVARAATDATIVDLQAHTGRPVSYFETEVLLCNYKQAVERKYPGRPQDTDLGYYHKVKEYWRAVPFPFLRYRHALFPAAVLGERQGWTGPREELGETFQKFQYFWSDLLFDYAMTQDLAFPVPRPTVPDNLRTA